MEFHSITDLACMSVLLIYSSLFTFHVGKKFLFLCILYMVRSNRYSAWLMEINLRSKLIVRQPPLKVCKRSLKSDPCLIMFCILSHSVSFVQILEHLQIFMDYSWGVLPPTSAIKLTTFFRCPVPFKKCFIKGYNAQKKFFFLSERGLFRCVF